MSYNRVILMGRITHDLELKTTTSGINMCSFQIAVDRRFLTKGEERKTDFFRVISWRQTAEFVTRYFRKGSLILVEGELQTNSYVDKNGNTVNTVEIVADQVSFTGEKTNNTQGGTGSYNSNAGGYQQNGNGGYNQGNGGYNQGNGGYNQGNGGNNQGNGGYNQGGGSGSQQGEGGQQSGGMPGDFKGIGGDNYPF